MMDNLVENAQDLLVYIKAQPLTAFFVTFILICLTTRLVTGQNGASPPNSHIHDAKLPPLIPYWVPYLGHIPQMNLNAEGFLTSLRRLYPNGAFSLKFLGTIHTIIFKPALVSALAEQSADVVDKEEVSRHLLKTNFAYPRSTAESLAYDKLVPDIQQQFEKFASGPASDQMIRVMSDRLRYTVAELVSFNTNEVDQTQWERLSSAAVVEDTSGQAVTEVDLFDLIRNFVAFTANASLFGSDFVENFPELWQIFWKFDDGFMTLAMDLPSFLPLSKAIGARRARGQVLRCLDEFEKAMETAREGGHAGPQWADIDNVSPLVQDRIDKIFRKHGVDVRKRASLDFSLLWGMNTTANPLVFWIIWRVYSHPDLVARIRQEIEPYVILEKPAVGFGGAFEAAIRIEKIDIDGLLNKCPLLKASGIETMRLDSSLWDFRFIRKDTIIGGKEGSSEKVFLPAGTYAHSTYSLHYTDPAVVEDVQEWKVERHIKPAVTGEKGAEVDVEDFSRLASGGEGVGLFQGGDFALREALLFSATIIAMYDIQPVEGKPWKLPKREKTFGVKRPITSTRVWIKSRPLPSKKS